LNTKCMTQVDTQQEGRKVHLSRMSSVSSMSSMSSMHGIIISIPRLLDGVVSHFRSSICPIVLADCCSQEKIEKFKR
jgi:hypothetical protein